MIASRLLAPWILCSTPRDDVDAICEVIEAESAAGNGDLLDTGIYLIVAIRIVLVAQDVGARLCPVAHRQRAT